MLNYVNMTVVTAAVQMLKKNIVMTASVLIQVKLKKILNNVQVG
jgi:hypothetical protein